MQSLLRVSKILVSSGGNVIFFHQVLGKSFASFQNSCIFSRSKYTKSFCLESIYDTAHQWIIHTYNGQIDFFFLGKTDQCIKFHGTDGNTFRKLRNARISGCTIDFVYFITFCNACSNCMFSSATTYYENIHFYLLQSMHVFSSYLFSPAFT